MPCRTDRHNSLALLPLNHNTNNSNRILMKKSELKLGDWVLAGGSPIKIDELVDGIDALTIYDDETNEIENYSYDDLSPIPLTSEILEKNGWKEDDEIWGIDYTFGHLHIEFFSNGKEIEAMVSVTDDRDVCCLRQIKYIHQLQHLLWALGIDDDLKI